MREVYRSLRLETVEGAAQMLRDDGIEVSIVNSRSYKGSRRRSFSFRDSTESGSAPQLWVVHNGDLPRARELLREAGLIEPSQRESYLSGDLKFKAATQATPLFSPQRLRTALLVLIVLTVGLFYARGLLA